MLRPVSLQTQLTCLRLSWLLTSEKQYRKRAQFELELQSQMTRQREATNGRGALRSSICRAETIGIVEPVQTLPPRSGGGRIEFGVIECPRFDQLAERLEINIGQLLIVISADH